MKPDLSIRTPSATELVAILSSHETTRIAKPKPLFAQLPRPAWWLRALILIALACLGIFTLFSVLAAQLLNDVQRLSSLQHQIVLPTPRVPLPAPELLLGPQTFAVALQRMPDEAGRLHHARAELLLQDGRHEEAAIAFAAAAASTSGLPAAQYLRWAELLLDLRRPEEARIVLQQSDTAQLNDDQRSQVMALIARCLLASRSVSRYESNEPANISNESTLPTAME